MMMNAISKVIKAKIKDLNVMETIIISKYFEKDITLTYIQN